MTFVPLHRRHFLRSAGVALALPSLDAMASRVHGREQLDAPKRVVFVCTSLGLHGPSLFPKQAGRDYEATPYLQLLEEERDQYTLFSGLSHPDQSGADGHSSQMTWLTSATHPGLGGFRNSISVDQFAREKLGQKTRFPTMQLSTHGDSSQSYTAGGVMVSAEWRPSVLFEKMFLQGKAEQIERERNNLQEGRSILDGLGSQAKKLANRVSKADGERLEAYFDSVRRTEIEFQQAGEWLDRPKPKVEMAPPTDIEQEKDLIGRTRMLMDMIPLIVQTDASRIITLLIHGRNDVPPIDGVTIDHHNLSHHGQDEAKIAQLQRIENEIVRCFGRLMQGLRTRSEGGDSLLKQTAICFGSNLGNANSHDWRNLPIFLGGGEFRHGQHIAYDQDRNKPLCNLYLTMLQKHMQLDVDSFGSSSSTLQW